MKKYEVLGNLTPGLPSLRGPVDPGSWVRLGGIRKTTAARQRRREEGGKEERKGGRDEMGWDGIVVLESAHAAMGQRRRARVKLPFT